MATNSPAPSAKKVFRIHRFAIGLNVLLQIAIVLFILGIINYISFTHYRRWDLSRDQKYALSEQTRQILAQLSKNVKMYVFFAPSLPGGELFPEVTALLKEYQYAAKGKLEVETIDPYKDMGRARDLMAKYKFGAENVVVVDYGGRSKLVNATDMGEYDNSGAMYGQPPQLKGFQGEQVLTGALLEVTEEQQNKVYFVTGKGGPDIKNDDLVILKTYLERENLKVDSLTLLNNSKIRDDAKAVILIGPKYDLTDLELKLLREYWDHQGRLFIALDPSSHVPKLDNFLSGLGVKPQDDRVLRTVAIGPMTGIVREVVGDFSDTSVITKKLRGVETTLAGQTQSLSLSQPPGIKTEPLLTAAEGFWGETKYQDMEQTGVSYDPKEDYFAPLTLAASVEKDAPADQSLNVETSRMVVTGNADFATTPGLSQSAPDVDFILASINWLLNRKELIGIAPKPEQQFTLNLTDRQLGQIELLTMIAIPLAAAMAGGVMWARRRR